MLKYLIPFIIILIVSCSGSKNMLKKGRVLEHNKQYIEASNFYFESLNRKSTNVDALVALKRVGKKVLNQHLNDFYKEEATGNTKAAVYNYLKASDYQKKLNRYKVYEEIPGHYTDKYESSKATYLESLYEEGSNLMEESDYKEAEKKFTEILKFDNEYQDAKTLRDISYAEPIFIKANEELDKKNYRNAYNNYELVLKRIPNYKDASASKARALELGRHTLVLFSFENSSDKKNIETKISNYIGSELSNLNDPFIRLVDRGNFQKIMDEQELAISGFVDESTSTKLGKLLGAQTAISGRIISYSNRVSRSTPQKKVAAEPFTVKAKQEDGSYINVTKYKKVNYMAYTKSADVHISFQYKLISLETSEILFSDIIELSSKDYVSYATYNGNSQKLHPTSDTGVNKNRTTVNKFRAQFTNRKNLKSEHELSQDLFKNISVKVAKKITQNLE